MRTTANRFLQVKGARVHNLQNADVTIPKNRVVVLTGVSGSGKSSLLFNTIYEEARARYLEIMIPNAFKSITFKRPDVDFIYGLLPPIAIEQRTSINLSPRSTVGTTTEIQTFLRMLFARVGESDKAHDGPVSPAVFSFNTPYGMCPRCGGLGQVMDFDLELVIPDPRQSVNGILSKAVRGTFTPLEKTIDALARQEEFSLDTPFRALPRKTQKWLLYGYDKDLVVDYVFKTSNSKRLKRYPGIVPFLRESYRDTTSLDRRKRIEKYMSFSVCDACEGKRLNDEALSFRVAGETIFDVGSKSVNELIPFFRRLDLGAERGRLAKDFVREILNRLEPLRDVGLGYLTLARTSPTLSAGESQRLSLAKHLGSGLSGLMYLLDEPTIGLHESEKAALVKSLYGLRDLGNSVLVVEHDEMVIRSADYVVDIGPGAGHLGGRILACGTPKQVARNHDSITGRYLRAPKANLNGKRRRSTDARAIELLGASENNLKQIDVSIPVGVLVCVTGASGSGKSSLIGDTLYPALCRALYGRRMRVGRFGALKHANLVDRVISIDQSPIGRSPRSNPASYVGVWDLIREFYATLPQSRKKRLSKGDFSFNNEGKRCKNCKGLGFVAVDMFFLSDIEVACSECNGRRYQPEVLAVVHKGKSISDVLDMTFDEAKELFADQRDIVSVIEHVQQLGLGYLKMGQPATTLAGGEAQRLKLIYELKKRDTGNTLYILDEPTTGLHFADVEKLMGIINTLVDSGNSVVVVEHNLEVIRAADYIIDLGPGGGNDGGELVACGTPEAVARCSRSLTGQYLASGGLH